MLDREKPARPAASALHFVGDHHDAMLVAQLANAREKSRRHGQESGFTLYRFNDDSGHGGWINLRHHGLFQLLDAEGDVFVLGHPLRRAIDVRNGQPHDLWRERAKAGFEKTVLAGEAQGKQRTAVVSALEADDGRSASVLARQLHCVFHALGAAVGEQSLLRERARRNFVQQFSQRNIWLEGCYQRARVNEFLSLVLDRLHNGCRRMANREHADAAGQIDERVSIHVEHQRAFGSFHHDIGSSPDSARQCRGTTSQHLLSIGSGKFGINSYI